MKKLLLMTAFLAASLGLASAADVKEHWDKHCAKCHGAEGKGDTKMGRKEKVRDYSDAKVQAEFTDEQLFKATKDGIKKDGKTKMKGYGDVLSDDEIKALVAHIRSFKK
jgi:cytochrome c553